MEPTESETQFCLDVISIGYMILDILGLCAVAAFAG